MTFEAFAGKCAGRHPGTGHPPPTTSRKTTGPGRSHHPPRPLRHHRDPLVRATLPRTFSALCPRLGRHSHIPGVRGAHRQRASHHRLDGECLLGGVFAFTTAARRLRRSPWWWSNAETGVSTATAFAAGTYTRWGTRRTTLRSSHSPSPASSPYSPAPPLPPLPRSPRPPAPPPLRSLRSPQSPLHPTGKHAP